MPEKAILLHGLFRSRLSMLRMAWGLRAQGFDPERWGYSSRGGAATQLAALRARLETLDTRDTVHFVGHSFGGILLRGALSAPVPFPIGRIVMIGAPNHGAGVIARAGANPWLGWIMKGLGRTVLDLAPESPFLAKLGVPSAEIGVIAGTRRLYVVNPSAWINRFAGVAEPHDGTVEVASTRLAGMRDFIVLAADHTFISEYAETIRQTAHFLRHGRFDRGDGEL